MMKQTKDEGHRQSEGEQKSEAGSVGEAEL